MRILLVDDDDILAQQLASFLRAQHYAVDVAPDGEAGWSYAQATTYDLIVLDINLPKLDGVRLCQNLRQTQYAGPILLLTAKGDSSDKVVGLDAGADDYLVKPCTLTELSARIRALLRRPNTLANSLLRSGDLCINLTTCEVTYRGQLLALSSKEYSLLVLFLRFPQRIFSSSVILEHLWSFADTPGEEAVRTHIKRLRRKLKPVGADHLIDTVYGMGYRLQPPPELPAAPLSPSALEASAPNKSALDNSAGENSAAGNAEARQAVFALWETFKPSALKRLASLDQAVAALQAGALSQSLRQSAAGDAHKLAGSLGMFGFPEGSRLSQTVERWLQSATASAESASQLQSLVAALRLELHQQPQTAGEMQPPSTPAKPPVRLLNPQPPLSGSPHSPVKVLVVDDDTAVLETLHTLLSRGGLVPITLNDPLQLWTILASEGPDLLILDVDMPHIDGIDLCRRVRNDSTWRGLPILFLTAHREPDIILRLYGAGADDYVAKPFTGPDIITRIFNRIERHQLLQTWRKPAL